ncbi:lipopolysaccharide export system protein LptA [Dysgonomonadaceae bacterium PH5-43]|nr:lipopolysaccharide export system protein LptA [Dysgonomonadaceae bacterium PH5-43]
MQNNASPSRQEDPKKVHMVHADSSVPTKTIDGKNIIISRGNVQFRHNDILLFCDSAYIYNDDNSIEAFDNVEIRQDDTLSIFGEYLVYEGDNNLAKMRYDVKMVHNDVILYTDNFNYDRNINLGYYFDGGTLVDSINELNSVYGQYSPQTKIATFKDEVILTNPNFVLNSDTLKYNTNDKIATILGNAVITSEDGIIYSDNGWYSTETDNATLYDRSTIVSKDNSKTITADTLFYNRDKGFAEAFSNMIVNDTVQKAILMGDYGYFDEINNMAFATKEAQLIEYSQKDSLFLHADTLQMKTVGEQREISAHYGVRFFRTDLQGMCDSLQYNTADSMLYMLKTPILWNTGYQITGDTIKVQFNSENIETFYVRERAFAVEEYDGELEFFNQIRGKYITGLFAKGELDRVEIEGSTESIYYIFDDKKLEYIGRAKLDSPYLTVYIKERKPYRMSWSPEPEGKMLPVKDLTNSDKFLKDFVNYEYLRPVNASDIFRKAVMKEEDKPAPVKRRQRN